LVQYAANEQTDQHHQVAVVASPDRGAATLSLHTLRQEGGLASDEAGRFFLQSNNRKGKQ
jgi:hypothetical protein